MPTKSGRLPRDMYPVPSFSNVIHMKIDKIIGIVSDTHIGSVGTGHRQLELIYDDFKKKGIKQVFHAGDLVDGENVYRGHRRYLRIHGYEAQANWTIDRYPKRRGMTTYVLTGNHDASYLIYSGADIVKYVCSYRKDMECLGLFYVRLIDKGFKMDMIHPRGGGYYSKSYGVQKWIRNNEMPSTYPDFMVFGHWHTHMYLHDHEVECIVAGNFQTPGEYEIRRGLTGPMGGWIVEFDRKGSRLHGLRVEWREKR